LVSFVDQEAEKMLVKELQKIISGSSFITEEGTIHPQKSNWTWVIDPLDGTTNFMHNLPIYAVSVALIDQHQNIVLGVIKELNRNECFYAYKGGGAYLNGQKIQVSQTTTVKDALLVTGFPYSMDHKADDYMKIIKEFQILSHGIRRLGSAATDMAYVACGRLDGYFEFNIKIWDIAAGICIINEAGGKVTDFKGNYNFNKITGLEVLAAGLLHNDMLNIVQKYWH
jgi:myo-inositol-1(or 4)-monophosphatase